VAPGVADDAERRALEAAEARADAATRLTFRRRGDGTTDLAARIPDAVAGRLRTYLEAFTAPRQAGVPGAEHGGWTDPATGARLSPERMAGEAFCAFIERYDSDRLPHHGGTATTVVVTVGLDQLLDDTGVAQTSTGTPTTPGEARRHACTAGLLPVVLGTRSEVLDLGRLTRLFTTAQRKALAITHPHCRAEGCTTPAAWCEAHHLVPWSHGGPTDLTNAVLLCHWHHRRAHDPGYDTTRHPNGELRYHRRI
jgi:Domain of unknown function (DUF222)/HNH endonuclease